MSKSSDSSGLSKAKAGSATRAVHAGEWIGPSGSLNTPIYQTSAFSFKSSEHRRALIAGEREGNIYTRWGNPTCEAAAAKIADLEGAQAAVVVASGMAAITSTVLTFVGSGDTVVSAQEIYGGTHDLFTKILPRLGVRVVWLSCKDYQGLRRLCDEEKPRLLFFETPSNPLLSIADLSVWAAVARQCGALSVIDGTFCAGVNQQPLACGIDLVVHSCTKYLGGHGDLIAGAVAGGSERIAAIHRTASLLGPTLDPHTAFLLLRGMKSLPLRMKVHNDSAMQLARWLDRRPEVARVFYPGLPDFPDHDVARRQMVGYGGCLAFELRDDPDGTKAERFVDALGLFVHAASLGGVESLVCQPAFVSHHGLDEDARRRVGIADGLIRLAVGLEDKEDLLADLERGLASLAESQKR